MARARGGVWTSCLGVYFAILYVRSPAAFLDPGSALAQPIEHWPLERFVENARNAPKNDSAVDRMCSSIREFGFKIPCLVRSDGEVVDGHLRLKAARKLELTEIPVILCDEWTAALSQSLPFACEPLSDVGGLGRRSLDPGAARYPGCGLRSGLNGFQSARNRCSALRGSRTLVRLLPAHQAGNAGDAADLEKSPRAFAETFGKLFH